MEDMQSQRCLELHLYLSEQDDRNGYVSKCGLHVGKTTPIEHRGHGKRGVHRRKESHSLCIGEAGSETQSGIETASDEAGICKAMESGSGPESISRLLTKRTWSVPSRPLKGGAPIVDLVLGYRKSNQSPILKLLLSRIDELVARVSKKTHQSLGV